MALGLGEISLESYLNEPLRAEVDLLNVQGLHEDQIRIRLATSEDFKRMGVDRAYFLTSISFNVEIDDSGRARIVLTSEDPVLEPYLDFIVEARWPSGRLLREYTVLVDPPVFDSAVPVVSASERVAEIDGQPAPAKKKTTEVVTSGTRVDLKQGDLAPGEMPRRSFNADTANAPISGSRYMIHRDDTLWSIASRARPGGASVQQTMLDIQRLNPDAFINGNINLIKAGYIIYLPTQAEISSSDPNTANQVVRQQNEAWREGRASGTVYTGPSLRISAEEPGEPAAAGAVAGGAGSEAGAVTAATSTNVALEELAESELARAELQERLVAMEAQVETLERIVSLKDDQIAALQGVIAGEQGADGAGSDAAALGDELLAEIEQLDAAAAADAAEDELQLAGSEAAEETAAVDTAAEDTAAGETVAADTAAVDTVEEEVVVAEPAPAAAKPAEGMSSLWYILGAVVLAVLGWLFMRRRKDTDDEGDELDTTPVAAAPVDAFADVELTEQEVELEEPEDAQPQSPEASPEDEVAAARKENRGYGQRKHDEYASDVEANGALAEADIYIAYGRYPQAIDLLRNALLNDPGNAAYRLKLLQLYAETGDRAAAEQQLAELESLGDEDSLAAARETLAAAREDAAAPVAVNAGSDLLRESGETLESDFSDLEIEEPETGDSLEDDLDLSVDFERAGSDADSMEEELVIAAESDGLSTKLDLARAYMDMGDDDGARQILEEVAAEGSAELQEEARALLERIG
jgi:pilus assembly protein FimV